MKITTITLCIVSCAVLLLGGCRQTEMRDRHVMDPMGDSVRNAAQLQREAAPPVTVGPPLMDGQKQEEIIKNYRKDNAETLPGPQGNAGILSLTPSSQ
ncbi:hypothetical protein N1030_07415 [Desulfovibrio mangrovi]|uniref:hypothetical protein n=1 Tax=Desulfovibrio mangrovi TaxID=2976983 RepID=UPI0022467743|nr:hypothetical protein [Desulfovibrio mangrovi]UZP68792.1 hypothetical protein N1030_07415 [Desulfovibrio mangrovi]